MANKAIYQRVVTTLAGDAVPNAEFEVINEGTGLAQTIYSDRAGTTPLTPPHFADANGKIVFYVEPGEIFRVTSIGGSGTATDRYVEALKLIEDLDSLDNGSIFKNKDSVATVDSIASLPTATGSGRKVSVTGYHAGTTVGGDPMVDAGLARHDGGTFIDPNRAAEIGTAAYYVDSGVDANCWSRVNSDYSTPEQFGASGNSDTTAAMVAYTDYITANKKKFITPKSALHTVNLLGPSVRDSDRRRVNSTGVTQFRSLFNDPSKGVHFIGDSVANGFSAGGVIPGNARESYSWPNLLGYGLRRNKSPLRRHDQTFNAPVTGVLHGAFSGVPLGAMEDFNGFLDGSITGGADCNILYCELTKPIEFTLPKGGSCDLHAVVLSGFSPTIDVTISINGSASFAPSAADKFEISGFPNPAVLDFTTAKAQHRILNIKYDPAVEVVVTFTPTDAQRLFFLANVTRTNTATIYTPTVSALTKNSFDVYGPLNKVCALSNKSAYNTLTVSYLADVGGADINVRFMMNDNTLVLPSSIAGIGMHDTLGAGGITNKDVITADATAGGGSGVQKYITRSYFMLDKYDLSEQGIVGIVLYNNVSTITVHDVSFHGIVNNEGVSGATTSTYLANEITRVVPYARQNDIVVIVTGINDWGTQEAFSYSKEKQNLRALANAVLETGAQVVFMTNTQVVFSTTVLTETDNRNLRFQDIQQAIVDVANEFGCPVIDWNAFNQEFPTWNTEYMADNLHPNRLGHLTVANGLLNMTGLPSYEG